ncbi:GNAT family N-acetyltransferase [Streptococcus loxodontisalivarius]|uniref:Ribosomal-protein-alanine N-acetyltransferase n=1 Tax=Streptococcus loxodontisalivarius TaxID=1349415 RepID=A0ABS2PTX8_9STRE|nr:GNAT family N-acetyltransferase [Streptococcus loxodontisalivarius]MBM7643494.1 ribosomal-protein-alanine N-acetyltransferase [Streptococcus loxodontisalivarius]
MDIWVRLANFAEIETERLLLKPLSIKDSQAFYDITQNPENLPFIFPAQASQKESDYLLVHYFLKEPLGKWGIFDKTSQEFLGVFNFEKLLAQKKSAEIGYFLKKSHWGRGLMTEVLKNLAFLSFQVLGLKTLIIITHKENLASQAVAKKAGFRLVRQYKGSDRYTHKMRDYHQYELRRKDLNE